MQRKEERREVGKGEKTKGEERKKKMTKCSNESKLARKNKKRVTIHCSCDVTRHADLNTKTLPLSLVTVWYAICFAFPAFLFILSFSLRDE